MTKSIYDNSTAVLLDSINLTSTNKYCYFSENNSYDYFVDR